VALRVRRVGAGARVQTGTRAQRAAAKLAEAALVDEPLPKSARTTKPRRAIRGEEVMAAKKSTRPSEMEVGLAQNRIEPFLGAEAMPSVELDPFVIRVVRAIGEGLARVGVRSANVDYKKVRGTKLYRFIVVSKKFKSMDFSERQHVVWRIVERDLPPRDTQRISMILTLTPDEAL
jgi:hypothetical protein